MIFVDNLIYDVDSKVDEVGQSFGIYIYIIMNSYTYIYIYVIYVCV